MICCACTPCRFSVPPKIFVLNVPQYLMSSLSGWLVKLTSKQIYLKSLKNTDMPMKNKNNLFALYMYCLVPLIEIFHDDLRLTGVIVKWFCIWQFTTSTCSSSAKGEHWSIGAKKFYSLIPPLKFLMKL